MLLVQRINRAAQAYSRQVRSFNRNIWLLLSTSVLSGIAYGIFSVDFNLYILSLGISPAGLGWVLSAGPFAQMLAAIPIGFLAELVGYQRTFFAIFAISGVAQLAQVSVPDLKFISAAAFLGGLAIAGNFVVRLPYLNANVGSSERTHVFSVDSLLNGATFALGALIAGHLPNLMGFLTEDVTLRYRYTLLIAGGITILAAFPTLWIRDNAPPEKKKISLYPYLWGMDRFTAIGSVIEFFIGLSLGLVVPFMNLYFIYHLSSSREFFSTVEALAWAPVTAALMLAPLLANRLGPARFITLTRFMVPVSVLILAFTRQPAVASASYWSYRALFSVSQSVWFALAMASSARKARGALSAWLEITFQMGMALAALVTGMLIARSNYSLPFVFSSIAAAITGVLTYFFIATPRKQASKAGSTVP